MFKSVLGESHYEFEIKKSLFIGHCFYVKSEGEAFKKIEEISSKYADATHNCHAFIVGEKANTMRFSDDGEPSGTAGMPMLEVIRLKELTNTLVIVTRYFGGTLLGAKGLVRAYSNACNMAINSGKIVIRKEFLKLKLKYAYNEHGKIINYINKNGYRILKEEFMEDVSIYVYEDENLKLINHLREMTAGRMDYEIVDKKYLPTINNKIVEV